MMEFFLKRAFFAFCVFNISFLFNPEHAHAVKIERVKSSTNIEAWLVRDHTSPIITVRFEFRGGSALDPKNLGGLASMTALLLKEGAGNIYSKAFKRVLEDLVITLKFNAKRDSFSGRLVTLVENRKTAFKLLKLAITEPRFDHEPIERIRSQILAGIRQNTQNPRAIASKRLLKILFPNHPYGRPSSGTTTSIKTINQDDLYNFAKNRFAKNNLIIGVVGDITPENLKETLDKVFGNLPAQATSWKIPEVNPKLKGQTSVIKKNIPQSSIVFADKGLKRNHPDFYAAYLMNHILGGGGNTSRLYKTIREEKGLAYSIYSLLHPLEKTGFLFGGVGTINAKVSEMLYLLRNQWTLMATKGVTEQELNDAKTYLTGSYPLRFQKSGSIAEMLVRIQLDNLGIDYMNRRNSLIEAVSLKSVNRIAKTLLQPKRLNIVVVGEPIGLKSNLK